MRQFLAISLILSLSSCQKKEVKYSAINDLVAGVQQIILYENGEFYLELGLGGVDGKYTLDHDTVILEYQNKPSGWPDKILMTPDYFETIPLNEQGQIVKIARKEKIRKVTMDKFDSFKKTITFKEDTEEFYTGLGDPNLQSLVTEKMFLAVDDFKEISQSKKPTDEKYQEAIAIGLNRFSDIYIDLDTEDRERICGYYEKLMNLIDLESSAGHLNSFMYGFDPSATNEK